MLKAIDSAVIGTFSGLISGAGADNVAAGAHVTKFVNSKDILNKTIANGTKSAIQGQVTAMKVHSDELVISGARFLMSHTFSLFASHIPHFVR